MAKVVAARGNRTSAMLLGAIGAVLQITAISQVVTNVHDPLSVGAYAAGVAGGVLLGLIAGDRLTPGDIAVTITTVAPDLAAALWARGWPATAQTGHGQDGPVSVLFLTISRRYEVRLQRDLATLAPEAMWTTEDAHAWPRPLTPVKA